MRTSLACASEFELYLRRWGPGSDWHADKTNIGASRTVEEQTLIEGMGEVYREDGILDLV